MTEQCYQPPDDDTYDTSQPGSKSQGKPPRKISLSLKGTPEIPRLSNTRHATPVAKKKFQCWDPDQRQRKISNISSERKISNVSSERKISNISNDSVFTTYKSSLKSAYTSRKN